MANFGFHELTLIINDWDPIDLMSFSPSDEYKVEVSMILDKLEQFQDVNSLAEYIHSTFRKQFDAQFEREFDECLEVAERILQSSR